MRLYKFLVISNKLMENMIKSKVLLKQLYSKKGLNTAQLLIFKKNKDIGLMKLDYPNECFGFSKENSAYVIVDKDKYNNILEATYNKETIGGKCWSFRYDTVGTRHEIIEKRLFKDGLCIDRKRIIEPRTGGIAYLCVDYNKKIHIPLHQWVKEETIPNRPIRENNELYYHIGHVFDCRREFINHTNKYQLKYIRNKIEPKADIYRGKRVLGGQFYFSSDLDCTCSVEDGNKGKCRECEGVLYIYDEDGLMELYNQLISDDYKKLINMHINQF